jgi:hypothetical protein
VGSGGTDCLRVIVRKLQVAPVCHRAGRKAPSLFQEHLQSPSPGIVDCFDINPDIRTVRHVSKVTPTKTGTQEIDVLLSQATILCPELEFALLIALVPHKLKLLGL